MSCQRAQLRTDQISGKHFSLGIFITFLLHTKPLTYALQNELGSKSWSCHYVDKKGKQVLYTFRDQEKDNLSSTQTNNNRRGRIWIQAGSAWKVKTVKAYFPERAKVRFADSTKIFVWTLNMDVLDFDCHLQGWKDKTKALKVEFQRQCEANEQFFVTDSQNINLSTFLEDPTNESTFLITGMKASAIVNLLRCLIVEYRGKSGGPFYFKFADDKKFKIELIPTEAKPGNGLLKVVGRMKYTNYPEMSAMLKKAGVTSKGLGDMIFKLNTQGMKSAFYNAISPMNELHFMMLFEVARRLVRGEDGQPISTDPEDEKLPYGVVMARIIKLLQMEENGQFAYEDVFGSQGKFNCFTDPNIIIRKQKLNALNFAYFEKIVKPSSADNEAMELFLQSQKNSVVIKTTGGYMEELREAFGDVEY